MRGSTLLAALFALAVYCQSVITIATTVELIYIISTPGQAPTTIFQSSSVIYESVTVPANPSSVNGTPTSLSHVSSKSSIISTGLPFPTTTSSLKVLPTSTSANSLPNSYIAPSSRSGLTTSSIGVLSSIKVSSSATPTVISSVLPPISTTASIKRLFLSTSSSAAIQISSTKLLWSFATSISSSTVVQISSIKLSSSSATHTSSSTVVQISSTKLSSSFGTSASASSSKAATASSTKILPILPTPSDYASTGTYYHSKHRLNHSAPIITWNAAQAVIAAEIASSCVFAHNMTVAGGGYGQNLAAYGATGDVAAIDPSTMLATSISNQWYYGECNSFLPSYYNQSTPDMSNFEAWGHFSQAVWKGSTSVGCASQYCAAGTIFAPPFASWFTVCNYVSEGNIIGEFNLNVFPSLGQPSIVVVA